MLLAIEIPVSPSLEILENPFKTGGAGFRNLPHRGASKLRVLEEHTMDNPAFTKKLTRQSVLGEFKIAGSRDPDVLQAVRERLLENSRTTRRFGTVFMAIGMVLIVLPAALGAPLWAVAIPFLPLVLFGWMQRSRGDGNIRLVDSVLAELASGS